MYSLLRHCRFPTLPLPTHNKKNEGEKMVNWLYNIPHLSCGENEEGFDSTPIPGSH
jgi:hypothetical protein